MKKWFFCFLFISLSCSARVYEPLDNNNFIYISGEIERGEAAVFEKTVDEKIKSGNSFITVVLTSDGGDLTEAMLIGRIIRNNKLWTMVPVHGRCVSSCVFILASGVIKNPFGEVGIHRPYITYLRDSSNADKTIKKVMKDAEYYFEEMNIPKSLVELMFSIPPEEVKFLTNNEKIKYRLDGEDYGNKEEREIRAAKNLNISRIEYMKREIKYSELEKECANKFPDIGVDYIKCANKARIRVGLNPLTK